MSVLTSLLLSTLKHKFLVTGDLIFLNLYNFVGNRFMVFTENVGVSLFCGHDVCVYVCVCLQGAPPQKKKK